MSLPLAPSYVRDLTEVEAAWIGAMIEGEGGLYLTVRRPHGALCVVNTEVETVATVLRLIGAGCIHMMPPTPNGRQRTLAWKWGTDRQRVIHDILRQVVPFLTGKKELAQRAMSAIEDHPYWTGRAVQNG